MALPESAALAERFPGAICDSFDICLSAGEILDKVDEMLAWEAIAAVGDPRYHAADLYRAEPLMMLPGGAPGHLLPDRVRAFDVEGLAHIPREDADRSMASLNASFAQHFTKDLEDSLASLGERLSYAWLEECDPSVVINAALHPGWSQDYIGDLQYLDNGRCDEWVGARYHLHSVAEVDRLRSASIRARHKFPQVARVFRHQHVVAFDDGRSGAGARIFASCGGRLLDENRMPTVTTTTRGLPINWAVESLSHACIDQYARRSQWIIELSLSENRTGIGLATDAVGARGFLSMLARDPSRRGRPAIVHWVQEHMRRGRRAESDPHLVRAHLRGKQTIRAGGYFARVYPSRVDIERACNGKRFDIAQKSE